MAWNFNPVRVWCVVADPILLFSHLIGLGPYMYGCCNTSHLRYSVLGVADRLSTISQRSREIRIESCERRLTDAIAIPVSQQPFYPHKQSTSLGLLLLQLLQNVLSDLIENGLSFGGS